LAESYFFRCKLPSGFLQETPSVEELESWVVEAKAHLYREKECGNSKKNRRVFGQNTTSQDATSQA
jgi:hypothetical protein